MYPANTPARKLRKKLCEIQPTMGKHWYIIHTIPAFERKGEESLESRVKAWPEDKIGKY